MNDTATGPLVTYTLFRGFTPQSKTELSDKPWSALVAWVKSARAYASKGACPLISMAEYGDTIAEGKTCLRYAENVRRIYGIEFDHDLETIGVEEVRQLLEESRIQAVGYTSANHGVVSDKSNGGPRWRVLCPLSEPAAPEMRAVYVARLNRILRGTGSKESFSLSQSFYIGRVEGVEYQTFETHGRTIDQAGEIEPQYFTAAKLNGAGGRSAPTDEALHQDFIAGRGRRQAMLTLTSRWAGYGMTVEAICTKLRAWMGEGPDANSAHHTELLKAIPRLAQSAVEKYGVSLSATGIVTVEDFRAYMPMHSYIFVPTREMWPCSSVDTRCQFPVLDAAGAVATRKVRQEKKGGTVVYKDVPMSPTQWLDENRPVEQMTWAPGAPLILQDQLVADGGFIDRPGCATFNLYRPSTAQPGDAAQATPWVDHVHHVFPDEAAHIIQWLAQRVQRPGEKINHALVLSGNQGTGKDSLLAPVKYAIGAWNFKEVSPSQLLGRFNPFLKSVILRISEARDLGEVDRYGFYEHTKAYCAAPPDVLLCDEKNLREHSVLNVCGPIITTNHKGGNGIYLPADDRRHFVAWTRHSKEDFTEGYWNTLHEWYGAGGNGHVTAYLAQLDLSGFDPKAPPPKTAAFWDIVSANQAPENAELADAIDALQRPPALTLNMVIQQADNDLREWLLDRRNRRAISYRLADVDYVPVRYDGNEQGLWILQGKRCVIYALKTLSVRDQIAAARDLVRTLGRFAS